MQQYYMKVCTYIYSAVHEEGKIIFFGFYIFLTILLYSQKYYVIYQNGHQFMPNNLDTWILCHMTVTWNKMGMTDVIKSHHKHWS